MATSITPRTTVPTASGDIAGSFTPTGNVVRLSAHLTNQGSDTLTVLRQNGTGFWEQTQWSLELNRSGSDGLGAAGSVEFTVSNLDKLHVLSGGGAAEVVTFESLSVPSGLTIPTLPGGDTIALLNAVQTLSNKTLSNVAAFTMTGSGNVDFSGSTGNFLTSTGTITLGGGAGAASLVSTGAAVTLTAGAASVWSTTAGALSLQGAGGINLGYGATTLLDVGVTASTAVTLAANKALVGAAGTGALTLGAMTGASTLPTGNLSWTGASTKTLSLVSTGAGSAITFTAGAASTWSTSSGALTLTSAAAATWGTAAGALTLNGAAGIAAQYNGATLIDVGATTSTAVTLAANIALAGAAGTGGLSLGSMTGATALPTGNLSWTGASTKTVSLVATGAGSSVTLTAGAASTWSTTAGGLTITSAAAATWSTAAGALTASGAGGINLQYNGTTLVDVGVTTSTKLTLAANKDLVCGTGTSAFDFSAGTGTFKTSTGTNTIGGKVAFGATTQLVTDPGNAGAISVATNGVCALTSAGAETRTLAIPAFVGQRLSLVCDTYVGNIVVTVASAFDSATHTTITFTAAGKAISLVGVTVGGTRAWRLSGNDGTTLG